MLALIVTEASLFAYLLFATSTSAHKRRLLAARRARRSSSWRIGHHPAHLEQRDDVVGRKGRSRRENGQLLFGLGASRAAGGRFRRARRHRVEPEDFTFMSNAYGSLYFTVTGFHLLHVIVGALMLTMLFVWTLLGYFGVRRHSTVSIARMYWHFVTIVWIAVFLTFYISPRMHMNAQPPTPTNATNSGPAQGVHPRPTAIG